MINSWGLVGCVGLERAFFMFSFFNFSIFACFKSIFRAAGHFDLLSLGIGLNRQVNDLAVESVDR